jgi:hypothetical protein
VIEPPPPDLQAPPARAYAAIPQMVDCAAIKHARQSIEARRRFSTGVIQRVGQTSGAMWFRAFIHFHTASLHCVNGRFCHAV